MKQFILTFCIIILLAAGCKKDETTPQPQNETYINTSAASTWNYQETDNVPPQSNTNYMVTSTSRDTTINGKTYHIYSDSDGGDRFLNVTGRDYYQFDSLPLGLGTEPFERLYLKDDLAAGATWGQTLSVQLPGFPFPLPVTITNTVEQKGISRTVNNIEYNNVIHVSASISATGIPPAALTTDIDSYYAPQFGLIENSSVVELNYLGLIENVNIQTKLLSADLK